MLKKRSKVQQRLAKIVMAALLCTNAVQAVWVPTAAEAATNVTVTQITGSVGSANVVATPLGSIEANGYGFLVLNNSGVGNVEIKGSSVPLIFSGSYPGESSPSGHTVTVSGANTVMGGVGGASAYSGAVNDNHVKIIQGATLDASIEGLSSYCARVVLGAQSFASAADVTDNTVLISGATIGSEDYTADAIVGAQAYGTTASATGNSVTIEGETSKVYADNITGGVAEAYYGASISAVAAGNEVIIDSGSVNASSIVGGEAYGFGSDTASATATANNKNTVTIDGGTVTVEKHITGGYASADSSATAQDNKVFINGGTVTVDTMDYFAGIKGGYASADSSAATGNTVTISGGTVTAEEIYGGLAYSAGTTADASGNTVIISGGTVTTEGIYGGLAIADSSATATGNTVTISGGIVTAEEIYGGYASGYSAAVATGNTVTISGSDTKLQGEEVWIVGGIALSNEEGGAEASNNTVNILTPLTVYGLSGGYTEDGISKGNTLNIAAKNVTATEVDFFQNMNFYLPNDIANGDTMLTIKGDVDDGEVYGNDLTGVKFGVAALKGVNLKKGDKVTLVKGENGLVTDSKLDTSSDTAEFLQQNNMTKEEKYELSIKKEGEDAIVTTVDDVKENETSPDSRKSPVETRMAVMTMINAGSDLLAGQGMANAEVAAQEVKGGSSMFAAMSGGQLRAESGSHVTTKGLGLNLGFAKEIENKSGKLMFGPVLEYGHGKYDSYQDNGMTADGKASYWGIGLIAKQTNDNGFYYEGSLRVGRAKSDYGSDSIVENSHISYDSSATYWAAHLGAGKVMDIGHNNTLDYYGKYFYSHTGGDSATIYRDGQDFDEIRFSGVNSNRLRVGARLTHALNEKNKIYGGLAYQYEFSGTARATYRDGAAPSPGVKGSSGMMELGWQVKPGKGPMAIDFGVTGWVGKQRGITANLQAMWTF